MVKKKIWILQVKKSHGWENTPYKHKSKKMLGRLNLWEMDYPNRKLRYKKI